MGKQLLRIELDVSFYLFGISCHLKDYRFAWTLNKSLNTDFAKTTPFFKDVDFEFSQYEYQLDLDKVYLFSNKCPNGFLIPKKRQVDYWMMFQNSSDQEVVQYFVDSTRNTQSVLAVFEENNKKIKEHFVF